MPLPRRNRPRNSNSHNMNRTLLVIVITLPFLFTGGVPTLAEQPKDPMEAKVIMLIDQMLNEKTEARAFLEMEALGCPAVPAIIQHMDDRRKLPIAHFVLQNHSPGAFEATRQYNPDLMVDALAAILNQLTGRSFHFIYNCGSEQERTAEVKAWKKYLETTPRKQLCK